MRIPERIAFAIRQLEEAGYEAYVVGGAVRDALLGLTPHDYDLSSSAAPEEILSVFSAFHCLTNGMKHGTVSVVLDKEPVEITSFRAEGEYKDHRHPESVRFVRNLKSDLMRRDFTVNALVYHPDKGLIDLVGGRKDLENRILRAIGEAEKRFEEDALRIVRGLRFSSVYGFRIEENTEAAMEEKKELLSFVSRERLTAEFSRLIMGKEAVRILRDHLPVVSYCLDERKLTECPEFSEKMSLEARLAVLLEANGLENAVLRRMKYARNQIRDVRILREVQNMPLNNREDVCFLLMKAGPQLSRQVFLMRGKDTEQLEKIIEMEVWSLSQLDVRGDELEIRDRSRIGEVLERLLILVVKKEIKNEKKVLLWKAKEIVKEYE